MLAPSRASLNGLDVLALVVRPAVDWEALLSEAAACRKLADRRSAELKLPPVNRPVRSKETDAPWWRFRWHEPAPCVGPSDTVSTSSMIALTGATGFIGAYLLRELTAAGHAVRVLLRRPTPLPVSCTNAVIGDLDRPVNMAAALAGISTIIHSAGLSSPMSGAPEVDFRRLNAEATRNLARSAERAGVRRFIFLSSVRAQADVSSNLILTEDLAPAPTDSYGRSKLMAEQQLAALELDWIALRLPLVFGPGVKGNMATLVKLARSALPLPFGALRARRSLLSLDNLLSAISLLMKSPEPIRRPFLVADPTPLSIPEMIEAMRAGIGRRPGLLRIPPPLLRMVLRASNRDDLYRRLAEPLVVDPSRMLEKGWTPRLETREALARVARLTP